MYLASITASPGTTNNVVAKVQKSCFWGEFRPVMPTRYTAFAMWHADLAERRTERVWAYLRPPINARKGSGVEQDSALAVSTVVGGRFGYNPTDLGTSFFQALWLAKDPPLCIDSLCHLPWYLNARRMDSSAAPLLDVVGPVLPRPAPWFHIRRWVERREKNSTIETESD